MICINNVDIVGVVDQPFYPRYFCIPLFIYILTYWFTFMICINNVDIVGVVDQPFYPRSRSIYNSTYIR
jgi:hypothetical protein